VTLRAANTRAANTLYDGLRPAALFGALESELRGLLLVLAPDVDARTCGRLLSALAKTSSELEALDLRLEGKSDEVRRTSLLPSPFLFCFVFDDDRGRLSGGSVLGCSVSAV
jgi:hypothetical protein